ncbi:MAG: SLC13 family permease [Bacteroidetes bacterium]|nr:SLC13 family permease [Bacteroidota bacterium]
MIKLKPFQVKWLGLLAGVVCLLCVLMFANFGAEYQNAKIVAAIAVLMSVWWITEAAPLSVTSLIPLVLFPLFGVVSGAVTAESYMNSTIILFMGGFIIAIAMEKWNLHKRIALKVIKIFGSSPSKIILGFMVAAGFISMWISNTATCLMILPIGLAIIYKVENEFGEEKSVNFSKSLMLAIAYASSIGGIGTFIGTPPNLIFQRMYAINFPNNPQLKFGEWMIFAVPLAFVMMIAGWLVLTKIIFKLNDNLVLDKKIVEEEYQKLGKITYEEKAVLYVFVLTSLLWIFRSDLELSFVKIPGWSGLFSSSNLIDDSTVAVAMALVLFLIPRKNRKEEHNFILSGDAIMKVPWDIVLLFGGGFALAEGFVQSGLSQFIGHEFAALKGFPFVALIFILCTIIVFSSELTSNTAQTTIILPILASLAKELGVNPLSIMIPATLSVSLAFMLPVGTPPNAIVFSSKRLKVWDMVKAGFMLNVIGIILVTILAYFLFD